MAKTYGLHKCLQFGLAGLLGWLIVSIFTAKTQAQQSNIVPDNTLGTESSQVIGNFGGLPIEVITGGAIRQINLFHSLKEFNISEGRGAYFFIPNADIQNILARVTGNNRSEILGTLGTLGSSSPNLYLINPNGIVFGKNASLNLQGSFVGTTANGVQFGNQGVFSATNPEAAPLLTVNPSALFFNQINSNAVIQNNGGLQASLGTSLALIGGNINLDGGGLSAPGGRIELGGLAEAGTVGIQQDGNTLNLNFPVQVQRADVLLNNATVINESSFGGASIAVNARNFTLINSRVTLAGINKDSGNIVINTDSLQMISNASIASFTTGKGNAGNIDIQARDKVIISGNNVAATSIISAVSQIAEGTGGNITIKTKNFDLNNAQISASSLGRGNAGNIKIDATEFFTVKNAQIGTSNFGQGNAGNLTIEAENADIVFDSSLISSTAGGNILSGAIASGQAGDIVIKGRSLSLINNIINSSTVGQGNAGNILLEIQDNVSLVKSNIIGSVANSATGQGGNVTIESGVLSLTDGSEVNVSTAGKGDGGKIFISTDVLEMANNSFIGSNALGKGNAGNITIQARERISIAGNDSPSGISSTVAESGIGNGGDIDIQTGSLLVNNSIVGADNFATGKAGNIRINAKDLISASGESSISTTSTGQGDGGNIMIEAQNAPVYFDGTWVQSVAAYNLQEVVGGGKGGDITIKARSLSLSNDAFLQSSAFGQGKGGNIFVEVQDDVSLSNSTINSGVIETATGKGGNINIQSDSLLLTDKSFVNSSSIGQGDSGNISINLRNSLQSNNSTIGTASTQSSGGVINITAKDIQLRGDSDIRTNVLNGAGGGGNITLTANTIIALEDSDILAFARDGKGGDITFNTRALLSSPLYRPQPQTGDRGNLRTELEGNDRADINASGAISGNIIGVPDITFLQNSLTELQANAIDTNALIANSCISRASKREENSFTIPGSGALPTNRPGVSVSSYATGEVRGIETTSHSWKKGDPIIEAQGFYRLDNGRLLLSRECSN